MYTDKRAQSFQIKQPTDCAGYVKTTTRCSLCQAFKRLNDCSMRSAKCTPSCPGQLRPYAVLATDGCVSPLVLFWPCTCQVRAQSVLHHWAGTSLRAEMLRTLDIEWAWLQLLAREPFDMLQVPALPTDFAHPGLA